MSKSETIAKKRISYCKSILRLQTQSLTFSLESTTEGELELASIGARELKEKLDKLQDKAIDELDETEFKANHEKDFETMYASVWSIQVKVSDFMKQKGALDHKVFPSFKLERIKIPQFSGKFTEWQSFHDLFKSSVHENLTLSGAEKMVHLKACLIGDASSIVSCFTTSDSGYKEAWDLVVTRYSNKREIIFSHLKKFDDFKPLQQESSSGLRSLADSLNECSRSLKVNQVPVEHWDIIFVFLAAKKLDQETRKDWLLTQKIDLPNLQEFIGFIENKASAISDSSLKSHGQNQAKSSQSHHSQVSLSCPKCTQSHHLYQCNIFKELPAVERKGFVTKLKLCFKCLFKGHGSSQCPTKFSCSICGGKHHKLIHLDRVENGQSNPVSPQSEESTTSANSVIVGNSCQGFQQSSVLMATLMASVQDSHGRSHPVRIFVDQGSESNFVSNHFMDRLGLKRKKTCVGIKGISGSVGEPATGFVKFRISSNVSDYNIDISALVVRKITNKLPRVPCQSEWAHLKGITFGDPSYHNPGHIDVLFGAGAAAQILVPGLRIGPKGSPIGQNTKFGWMVFGDTKKESAVSNNVYSNHVCCSPEGPCLESSLSRFWTLEESEPSNLIVPSKEDIICEDHFVSTHRRQEDGRYMVELPFKANFSLGQSRAAAVDRFLKFEKRLHGSSIIKEPYIQTFRESLQSNHMEIVPHSQLGNKDHFYLPHHAVIKLSSSSTKVRVVYDASMKSNNGKSLNDVLMTGPKIQVDLFPLLLRFRTHLVAVSADIVRFYNQFMVDPEHCNYQRLVWRESPDQDLQDYRLLRVTFGVTSAPFLSIRCLHQLAEDEKETFPLASQVLKTDFLVDNLLSGSSTIEAALELQSQLIKIMERGQMSLRKWTSNSLPILEAVPPDHREQASVLSIDEDSSIKTIGILWFPSSDSFGVSVSTPDTSKLATKRRILSATAKIFDPHGWLSPVTVKYKILLQQLWKEKIDWDTSLIPHYQNLWSTYCLELEKVKAFRISRCVVKSHSSLSNTNLDVKYELHGFSDSSQLAYSACVYVRTVGADGVSSIVLVAAKTKVAPIKAESIPRLELCGGVLLVKLLKVVQDSLNLPFRVVRCWTDSSIILDWIKSEKKLPVFISNRVRKIQFSYPSSLWFHCPGEENPADCASRGISVESFLCHPLWLNGPEWLCTTQFDDNNQVMSHSVETEPSTVSQVIINCSSFSSIIRIFAYIVRFVNNYRVKKEERVSGLLSVSELDKGLKTVIKIVQSETFSVEIRDVSRKQNIKSYIKFLSPFIDDERILRVGGRLSKSLLTYDQKHPILLPKKHHFTEVLIRYHHLKYQHAGPQLLLAIIRNQFWIQNGRDVVRRVIHSCVRCHRQSAQPLSQLMGQLPSSRVKFNRPFSQTGMDFAGPFYLCLRPGRNPIIVKAYVAIFVCMGVRAVHLELVSDLSTPAFTAALTRFISRRGLPSDLYSDGGKNFIGAGNEMKEFLKFVDSKKHQVELNDFLVNRSVQYHFNPPLAPHHGGLWEAGVKSMKYHLKRIIENQKLSMEEFLTLLCQVESTLNSRPLTQLSSDPADLSVLTPGHFLIGDSMSSLPQHDLTHLKSNRLSRWQVVQQQAQHFGRRWSSEYLSQLQSRPKWCHPVPNLEPGMLVLLKDEDSSFVSSSWKLARVISVFPGEDGKVRVCEVKTGSGATYRRPISKISPLPIYE